LLSQLRYTTRVINESMRLYPQPPVLIRRALEDDQFDNYTIEKGADIFISVWNLHHSPDLWKDPEVFNPDRFPLDAPIPNEVTQDYAYLPFGGGKRKCVGDQFALFESVVGLSMLMRRYDFIRPANAPPVGMTTGATIHTTEGLMMLVQPRAVVPSQGMVHAAKVAACPALQSEAPKQASESSGGCPMGFGKKQATVEEKEKVLI
jgi:beta-ring hydroxylase